MNAKMAGTAVLLCVLAACAPREEYRGAVLDETRLQEVRPGRTEADVTRLLGSPSSTSTFSERGNTWFYITRNTETMAFFAPEIVSQRVVAVDFGGDGRVREIRQYGMKDGQAVSYVERETPTKSKKLSIIEQFLGNIGKFNENTTSRR
jgi:outer membrane protein assembly factor BamE (lipoprotein component of BamABCDE complex)